MSYPLGLTAGMKQVLRWLPTPYDCSVFTLIIRNVFGVVVNTFYNVSIYFHIVYIQKYLSIFFPREGDTFRKKCLQAFHCQDQAVSMITELIDVQNVTRHLITQSHSPSRTKKCTAHIIKKSCFRKRKLYMKTPKLHCYDHPDVYLQPFGEKPSQGVGLETVKPKPISSSLSCYDKM